MTGSRMLRKLKMGVLTTVLAGGTLFGSWCTAQDIQKNLVAGALTFVKNGSQSFFDTWIPMKDVWADLFSKE
ncbi:MAG: hypothetical protein JXB13_11315 [Phycisphaerae bacterium]|nr:hypothetical protein [Phycisphaerae bacterium]